MKRIHGFIIIIVVLALAGITFFLAVQYRSSLRQIKQLKENPDQVTSEENKKLIAKVEKLVVLPSNETPTIATVSEPEKLKAQAFFAQAEKDDKVLIYTNAKKAYLYSVKQNKILEIAPVNIGDVASPSPSATVKP